MTVMYHEKGTMIYVIVEGNNVRVLDHTGGILKALK